MQVNRSWKPIAVGAVLLAGAAGGYVAATSTSDDASSARDLSTRPMVAVDDVASDLLPPRARVLMRSVDEGAPRADGDLYELSAGGEMTRAGGLRCKQVHASPAGPGLCLALTRAGVTYDGIVFDAEYRPQARFPIEGVPDRARVSGDGRYGAYTTFAASQAEGYFSSTTDFSTNTRIIDMRDGTELVRLDDLEVSRDGEPLEASDGELWGVTFGERGRYYATLAAGDEHYLIEGHVRSREADVVHEGVECPSLSPDGTRIAYKHRIGDTNRWRLHVLDLRTGEDTPLAEPRSIDDQAEWLGDDLIVYSDDKAVLTVPADGGGVPERLAGHAASPASLGT